MNEAPPRRRFLAGAAALSAALGLPVRRARARDDAPVGHLVVIGGAEDRREDKFILRRFVELCRVPDPLVLVVTAASGYPEIGWNSYRQAFADLDVTRCEHVAAQSREEADDPALARRILEADGIFLSGGDQRRLMAVLGGSLAARALRRAYREHGACVGGTSAGAAAMSRHMLAEGRATVLPEKGAVRLTEGLGLLPGAIVDQHFSERRRLGRLLSAVAQRSELLGVGIDENTALVVEAGRGVEVVGAGNVTVIDGRRATSNYEDVMAQERLELLGLRLHLLPNGAAYAVRAGLGDDDALARMVPPSMQDAVSVLVTP